MVRWLKVDVGYFLEFETPMYFAFYSTSRSSRNFEAVQPLIDDMLCMVEGQTHLSITSKDCDAWTPPINRLSDADLEHILKALPSGLNVKIDR